jgi:hypothetical protein
MIRARGAVELDSHILFVLVYHSDMNYHVVDCNPSSSALTLDMWIKKILNDGHQKWQTFTKENMLSLQKNSANVI